MDLRKSLGSENEQEGSSQDNGIRRLMDDIKDNVSRNSKALPFDKMPDDERHPQEFSFDEYFKIDKKIGSAYFGKVYQARIKGTEKVVAVKTFSKKLVLDNEMVPYVKMEADVHRRIRHPHIVRFYGHFQNSKTIYFVLELVPQTKIKGNEGRHHRHFPESQTAIWMAQIIDALAFCHRNNIMHRDIKWENVLIDEKGHAKLIDFGLAYPCESNNSIVSYPLGTRDYFSPEMLFKYRYDKRTDVWSLGVLCYEFLVGQVPFEKSTIERSYECIEIGVFTWPAHISLSSSAINFVDQLLQPEEDKRMTLEEALRHRWIIDHTKEVVKHSPTIGEEPECQFEPMTDKWWLQYESPTHFTMDGKPKNET